MVIEMNYIGSKYTLIQFLNQVYCKIAEGNEKTFCDIFAGTGAVGRHFKRLGLRIIANDLQYYAYVLNKAYIEISDPPDFAHLRQEYPTEISKYRTLFNDPVAAVLKFINNLSGKQGFIAQHYGPDGNRLYYTRENAEKADAIRQAIEEWRSKGTITEQEYFYV